MTQAERERLIHRIIAGFFVCNVDNHILLLKYPTRYQRYMAEEVYFDACNQAIEEGSFNDGQYADFLIDKGLWSADKQKVMDGLPKDIEELKLGLFNATFKSKEKETIRKALQTAKEELQKLHIEFNEYNYMSAAGVANMAKARYLVATSLCRTDGSRLYKDDEIWMVSDYVIESAAIQITKQKLQEAQLRELARTDPWRTIWMARKNEGAVFGIPAVDLNDEQRLLSIWSGVYDNVYEHPDCPADEAVQDDDMLDGWMIFQKRKREAERAGQGVDGLLSNEKIRNSEEVYIVADTVEDARKISSLNDTAATITKRKRESLIAQRGVVQEQDMPDSQLKIRTELTKMYMNKG